MNSTWLMIVAPVSLVANRLTAMLERRWLRSEGLRNTARATLLVAAFGCFGAAYFNVAPLVMNGAAIVLLAIYAGLRKARVEAAPA